MLCVCAEIGFIDYVFSLFPPSLSFEASCYPTSTFEEFCSVKGRQKL